MKKGLIYLAAVCLLAAGCMMLFHPEEESVNPLPEVAEKNPGTLEGLVILVDPGHGGYDGGARGKSGLWEKEINLQMANAFLQALERRGAKVILTRTEDKDFAPTKRADLDARLRMAEGADLLLSVHMNKYHDERESGPQVFYRKGREESRLLAGCLQAALIENLQPNRQRQSLPGDYYMLQLEIPSVLVECGFLSNPEEEKMLRDADYQKKLAEAVAEGIEEYRKVREGQ